MIVYGTGGRCALRCRCRVRTVGRVAGLVLPFAWTARVAPAALLLSAALGAPLSARPPGTDPLPDVSGDAPASPLLLVPPEPGGNRMRIDALAADPEIDRVIFYVDGQQAGTDRRRPFRLKLRSAVEAIRSLRAEAYDRDGSLLGEADLDLAPAGPPFHVAISEVDPNPARGHGGPGQVTVRAAVSVPPDRRLDRIDVFLGETLVTRLTEPPLEVTLSAEDAGPDSYLRVVAWLDDGRSLEDARPLYSTAPSERLDVCLIDIYAVVSDRWGEPVRGLDADDFRVRAGERRLTVDRFQEASEVPLGVGLLVDSSESMRPIMDEAKRAAGTFLEQTLIPGDEAFLVDVDTVPRLVRDMTPSAEELGAAFADLEAGGTTALYDAILLGLLRLERHPGRRALVVLTDGRDFGSDFGPGRCRRLAERAGVPIYVLSMARLSQQRTNPGRNFRLESLARSTGGRVLHVDTPRGFDRAYAEIDRELRSQYILGIASDRVLSDDELTAITLEVDHPGAHVRATRSRAGRRD